MNRMNRKKFFSKGIMEMAQGLWKTPVGNAINRRMHGIANLLDPIELSDYYSQFDARENDLFVRPPGAVDSARFDKLCTECGDCIEICPNHAIFNLEGAGPVINPNNQACLLCIDFPCIEACDEDALQILDPGVLPHFGHALLVDEFCLNFPDSLDNNKKLCRDCLDVCPVESAISLDSSGLPQILNECTGCGLCVQACPAYPVALQIVDEQDQEL